MENLTDSFKNMRVGRVLFNESADSDKEDIIKNCHTGLSTRRSFSVEGVVCLQDEDFYPSEVGKMMIWEDQLLNMEAGYMPENVNACSAWELNSEVPFQDFSRSVNRQCQELFGDYRTFNDCSRLHTSTPVSSRKFPTFRAHLATKDKILNYHKVGNKRDSGLFPMLLNTDYSSTTAATAFNAFKIVGTANTKTLEAREIPEETFGACSGSFKGNQPNFQSLDSSIRSGEHINVRIPSQNEARSLNGDELWTVDPQVLTLDVKGKGRLQLINKSLTRNLKFKIEFNSKLITVCPPMGSIKSKSKIGLRVSDVSRGVNNNVVMEDVIRITCGNTEKEVPVQIYKFQKEKTFKNRTFRCF